MNTQFILPLLLLPYLVIASTDVEFTNNPAEAQARALREGKLYFVHFTATWCMPCQWMEKNTFSNDTLATFVHDHYLAVKVDFDDPNAATYKRRFQVTSLPSLLIFNTKGELLDRFETSLSKDELLLALQKHATNQSRNAGTNGTIATRVAYTNPNKISRPALIPDEAKTMEKPSSKPAPPAVAAPKTPAPKPMEIAEPTTRFAIQVGVFSDYANAERTRIRMEQRFNQPSRLLEIKQNDKKLYKVMIGKFENKEDAGRFMEHLSTLSVAGFVKNMDN